MVLLGMTVGFASGCTVRPAQTPQERLQNQAAADARQVHHDLKDAGKEARQAIQEAGKSTKAIVAGARQGWAEGGSKSASGRPSGSAIDINHAPLADLEHLPGITPVVAKRIVAGRPYDQPEDLRRKGVVSRAQYDRLAGSISAD